MGICLHAGIAAVTGVVLSGCGPSPITSVRIEAAIEATFANLAHVQLSLLGLPPMAASDFAVTASCRRLLAGNTAGAGEWQCRLIWRGPDGQTLHDAYDLVVTSDGCYTATAAEDTLGGPTVKARDGRDVRNLLYTFEGCFDTA